jgi:hypothetical protein
MAASKHAIAVTGIGQQAFKGYPHSADRGNAQAIT